MTSREAALAARPRSESIRLRFVLFTMLLGIAWSFVSSLLGAGWVSAALIVVIILTLYLGYLPLLQDGLIGRLLLLGVAAGVVELLADRWLVASTQTLVYAPGPMLVLSPVYMPLAWAEVLLPLAYLGHWLAQRLGLLLGSFLIALFGAVYIPAYEQFAHGANWWHYQQTGMLGHAPWYIILGEFLIVLPLPALVRLLANAQPRWVVIWGGVEGLWIWGAYAIAFALLGRPVA